MRNFINCSRISSTLGINMCNNIMLIGTSANDNMAPGGQSQPWSTLRISCSSSCIMSKSILYKKFSLLNLVWCKVLRMNGFSYWVPYWKRRWTMERIDPNVIPNSSKPFSRLKLNQRMVSMGQNDHANVLVIQKSKNTIIVAKKEAHDQESHYWRHPYSESELFEPNLWRQASW